MYTCTKTICQLLKSYKTTALGSADVFYFSHYILFNDPFYISDQNTDVLLLNQTDYEQDRSLKAACFIVFAEDGYHPKLQANTSPVIVVYTNHNDEVYRLLLQQYYQRIEQIEEQKNELLNVLSRQNSIPMLLQTATRMLQNPFIVYDNNYSLLYHSIPRNLNIPAAQNVIKNGYANVDIIAAMEKEGLLDHTFKDQPHPTHVKIINGYEKLAVSIYEGQNYVGLLCYFNYVRPIVEEDYEIVEYIGKLIRIYAHNQTLHSEVWTPWDYIFTTLIKQQKSITPYVLENLDIQIPSKQGLLVFGYTAVDNGNHGRQLRFLEQQVKTIFRSGHFYLYENYLLCLDSYSNIIHMIDSDRWPDFKKTLTNFRFGCGISYFFNNINDLSKAYNQACSALEIGIQKDPNRCVYYYKDFMFSHLIRTLEKVEDPALFYYAPFQTLLEYDAEYGTQYVDFLVTYLGCDRDNKICAERLNIHFNSVKYRIEKIQDIAGFNLKDTKDFINMYTSVQIYLNRHLDQFDHYKTLLGPHIKVLF